MVKLTVSNNEYKRRIEISEHFVNYIKITGWILFASWIVIGIMYGLIEWYGDIFYDATGNSGDGDCYVDGYTYDVKLYESNGIVKYNCLPMVTVRYDFAERSYHNIKTRVWEYNEFDKGIVYNNFTSVEIQDCINHVFDQNKYTIDVNIKHCKATHNNNIPPKNGCLCRANYVEHGGEFIDNNCCSYGYNYQSSRFLLILVIMLIIIVLMIILIPIIYMLVCDKEIDLWLCSYKYDYPNVRKCNCCGLTIIKEQFIKRCCY